MYIVKLLRKYKELKGEDNLERNIQKRKSDWKFVSLCNSSDKCYENNFSTKGFKESDKLGGEDPYSGSKAWSKI